LKRVIYIDGSTLYRPKSSKQVKDRQRQSQGKHCYRGNGPKEAFSPDTSGSSGYKQGGRCVYWGVVGQQQWSGGTAQLFANVLRPHDLKTKLNGKGKSVKNDNSVAMNTERMKEWAERKLVPWCRKLGFPMKGRKTPKGKRPIICMDHERCLRTKSTIRHLKSLGFDILNKYPVGLEKVMINYYVDRPDRCNIMVLVLIIFI